MKDFAGRTAFVTGGANGFGFLFRNPIHAAETARRKRGKT